MKNKFILSLTLCWLLQTINSAPADDLGKIPTPLPALSIDLKSCRCLAQNEPCEISIAKSLLLIETECSDNFNYCCKGKSQPLDKDKNTNQTQKRDRSESGPAGNKTIELSNEPEPSPQKKEVIPMIAIRPSPKPQRSCLCTARADCEEKHTDYSFGFHCTHDRVHCCPPKIMTTESNDPNNKIGKDKYLISNHNMPTEVCRCVAETECRKFNEITKRKDTLCPFNLIECCGAEITKKSDTIPGEIDSFGLVAGRGMTIGQTGFNQPIQLPEQKLPQDVEEGQEVEKATMSPPDLPTHYHNHEETSSGHFYGHQPILSRPVQRTPYYGNNPPYWQRRPATYYTGTVSQRSSPSLTDSIWNFFTG